MELIHKYFSDLNDEQIRSFEHMQQLYADWNEKINVISRKDMDSFYERHVLHSLGIAKVASFEYGSTILDVGTGGGFPGLPLAVYFPGCHFTLVDSIGKKIKVVEEISRELGLTNVTALNARAEKVPGSFDQVVSRAVTQMPKFMAWVRGKISATPKRALVKHGIWYLKGGDLTEELAGLRHPKVFNLKDHFEEEFFETKKVVYIRP